MTALRDCTTDMQASSTPSALCTRLAPGIGTTLSIPRLRASKVHLDMTDSADSFEFHDF